MIQALLWDNDGVLVDTEPLYYQANFEVLKQVGITLHYPQFVQMNLREGRSPLNLVLNAGYNESYRQQLVEVRNDYYEDLLRKKSQAFPGVKELLNSLHGKIPMAIVTSSIRKHFDMIHQSLDLLPYFDFILTREDYQQSKPHPEPYQLGAERMEILPEHCLAIEDSPRGLTSAKAAGLQCAIVRNPHLEDESFTEADHIFTQLEELTTLLQGA